VRIGGTIPQPAILVRVDPVYPQVAVFAHVAGVVVLEATVDREGRVQSVRVLRSIPLLNQAAIDAVRQWRYAPLLLQGTPVPFILTVTVAFGLTDR
jgi:protein TonB